MQRKHPYRGFTLIELLVVLAIIGTLLSLALPRYNHSVDKAKEAVLKQNLATMRDAIDKYHADTGHFPPTLDDLVVDRYLRTIPQDPMTNLTTSWQVIMSEDANDPGVTDVRSTAKGLSIHKQAYRDW